jgi:hypothetical protein
MNIHKKFLAYFLIILILPLFAFSETIEEENQPPAAEPIKAELIPPVTYFQVKASDPDGDELDYAWSGDITCGFFMADGSSARWDHPHGRDEGMCPEQSTSHSGIIYVTILDNKGGMTQCKYLGSEAGTGLKCTTNSANPAGGIKIPVPIGGTNPLMTLWYHICYWLWLPILISGIWLASWLWTNGLFVKKGPCEKEKIDEAAARSRMNSTKSRFEDIDRSKQSADEADKKAHQAQEKADKLKKAAGTRWSASGSTDWEGEHTELHKEGWHNKEAGAKADAAQAEADSARQAADKAKSDFEAKGGSSAWSKAKQDMEEAKREWEKAEGALKVCLGQLNAPKPTPTSPPTPPPTDGPTQPPPTTGGPAGPVTSTPTPPVTQARICINREKRNEKSESVSVRILDLQSVRLMQDKIYSDAGNEAMKFVDYLQTLKDLFNLGKKLKGGVDGYLDQSLTGTAEALDIPDFYTWYDKGIDALTKSMHKLHELILDKQRLGDYWLEYQYKNLTLTCRSYEVCNNNGWIKKCELTVEDNGMASGRTDPQSVLDTRELRDALTRLFNQLKTRFNGDKNRAKQFTESCNRCL